jgi:hypothetical protein
MILALIGLLTVSMLAVSMLAASDVDAGAGAGPGAPPDPAAFDDPLPNEYFPLEPGWVATLHGTEGGERLVERVVVTDRTKVVQGITTTVIRDVIRHKGVLVEKTDDWYAADDAGTVWYFGEETAEYDDNGDVVSTDGS